MAANKWLRALRPGDIIEIGAGARVYSADKLEAQTSRGQVSVMLVVDNPGWQIDEMSVAIFLGGFGFWEEGIRYSLREGIYSGGRHVAAMLLLFKGKLAYVRATNTVVTNPSPWCPEAKAQLHRQGLTSQHWSLTDFTPEGGIATTETLGALVR